MSEGVDDPLGVCLLVNGNSISEWAHAAIEQMLADTGAEITLVVRNRADRSRSSRELLRRAIELREWTVVTLVRKATAEPPSLSGAVDVDECDLASDARVVDCVPETVDGWKTALPEETVAEVADEADVGLLFGFGVLVGDALEAFDHGILSYHHGDFRRYRGQPAGCWEFLHDETEVGITVQRINERLDAGEIVVEKTVPIHDAETYTEIRSRLYEHSEDMLAAAVSKIESGRVDFETVDDLGPVYTIPDGTDAWQFLLKDLRGTVRRRVGLP